MRLILILVLCLLMPFTNSKELSNGDLVDVIKSFYVKGRVSLVTAFLCWSKHEHVLYRSLSSAGIHLRMVDIEEPEVSAAILDERYIPVGIVVDLACDGVWGLLREASKQRRFTIRHHWLVVDKGEALDTSSTSDVISERNSQALNHDDVIARLTGRADWLFQGLDILPDSKVTWIHADPHDSQESPLLEVHRTYVGHPLVLTLIGSLDGHGNLRRHLEKERIKSNRHDLQGAVLKAATVIDQPKQYRGMYDTSEKHVNTWTKVHFPVAELLARELNFSMDVVVETNYGWRKSNGSFDGMIGMMERREIDISVNGIFMRTDRMPHVDFVADTFCLRTSILFRQPSLSSVSNLFILPFSKAVWVSTILTGAITVVLLGVNVVIENNTREAALQNNGNRICWADVFTFGLGVVCQQGCHLTPSSLSGRITFFMMFLMSIFMYNSYAANIVALIQTPSTAVTSLVELSRSLLSLGIQNITYNHEYIKEVDYHSVTGKLLRNKVFPQGAKAYCTPEEGVERIRDGMYAFQVDLSVAYKLVSDTFTQQEKCGLKAIQLFNLPRFSMATVKHSPYREMIAQRVRRYREVGILDRLWKMWVYQKPVCDRENMVGYVSVGIGDFWPALLVLRHGMMLSVIVLLLEIVYSKRMKVVKLFKTACSLKQKEDNLDRRQDHELINMEPIWVWMD